MNIFNTVVYLPNTGGHHLALMLSTAFNKNRQGYFNIYKNMASNLDNHSSYYGNDPVIATHLDNLTPTSFTRDAYPYNRVFLLSLPKNLAGVAYRRMLQALKNEYILKNLSLLYRPEYISNTYNLPLNHILTFESDTLFSNDIGPILYTTKLWLNIDIPLCEELHKIWIDKVINTV